MLRRALLPALALAVLAVAPTACLSPTLPLPPPEVESISQASTAGEWEVAGDCTAGAIVTVLDEVTGEGVSLQTKPETGLFVVDVAGAQCDAIQVWEESDGELSSANTYVLQATMDGNPVNPTLCE